MNQLIQKKISNQVTEMVHELETDNMTKLPEMWFNDVADNHLRNSAIVTQ